MLKKFLLAAAVALPMMAAAQTKIATVDIQQIIPNMPEYTEAMQTLDAASKQYEEEFTKLQQEIQKLYDEYQQLEADASTPQTIKERRIQEIQDRQTKAQQFVQTAQQDIERQQAQLMQPVTEKMRNAINTVGANNGITVVLPAEVPMYVSGEVIDITPMVKTQLGI